MNETTLAAVISVSILGALAVWVPFLHTCHGCVQRLRLLDRRPAKLQPYLGEQAEVGEQTA